MIETFWKFVTSLLTTRFGLSYLKYMAANRPLPILIVRGERLLVDSHFLRNNNIQLRHVIQARLAPYDVVATDTRILVVKGWLTEWINGEFEMRKAGDTYVLRAGQHHRLLSVIDGGCWFVQIEK